MKIPRYGVGDYIFVPMKISKVEILEKGVFYRTNACDINGDDILVPESKITCGIHVEAKQRLFLQAKSLNTNGTESL